MTNADLIARLEAGSGIDRDIDESIWAISEPGARIPRASVPKYTDSLDAAISLVEKMLPGWQFTIYHDGAQISHSDPPSLFWGRAKDRPRALLSAMLKALERKS